MMWGAIALGTLAGGEVAASTQNFFQTPGESDTETLYRQFNTCVDNAVHITFEDDMPQLVENLGRCLVIFDPPENEQTNLAISAAFDDYQEAG